MERTWRDDGVWVRGTAAVTTDHALMVCDVAGRGLRGVSLALVPGEIAAVVGPAGAGKSTLLAMAAGRFRPRSGSVQIYGMPPETPLARHLIGYSPETPSFPSALTPREALEYYAHFHGRRHGLVHEALDAAGLTEGADRSVAALGRGDLHRLALAQAILGGRQVLLLDELLSGVDGIARRDLRNRIARLAAGGIAVLLAARDPGTLERLAVRVFVMRGGRIVRAGPLAALLSERILEVVLDSPPLEPPPGFRVTASGLEAPLSGRTVEAALALCHAHRLPVRASRIRMKSLEEIVLDIQDSDN